MDLGGITTLETTVGSTTLAKAFSAQCRPRRLEGQDPCEKFFFLWEPLSHIIFSMNVKIKFMSCPKQWSPYKCQRVCYVCFKTPYQRKHNLVGMELLLCNQTLSFYLSVYLSIYLSISDLSLSPAGGEQLQWLMIKPCE